MVHEHSHPEHAHHDSQAGDETAMARLLDLDADLLAGYYGELTGWLAELVHPSPRRILDVGSGTGAGTVALLRQFDEATVTALDVSPRMGQRLQHRANELGLADRVRTLEADLNGAWPLGEPADLVWAASSLHHLDDAAAALRQVHAALRPGGVLAATEMDHFPRVLPDDLGIGRPGLEGRVHAVLGDGPDTSWTEALAGSGLTLETVRPFVISLPAPGPAAAGAYAQAFLTQMRAHLGERLDAQDLSTLDALLDADGPHSLLRRTDLRVETIRTTWVARRPA